MAFKERTTTQDYLKSTYFGGWPNLEILLNLAGIYFGGSQKKTRKICRGAKFALSLVFPKRQY